MLGLVLSPIYRIIYTIFIWFNFCYYFQKPDSVLIDRLLELALSIPSLTSYIDGNY